MTSAFLRQTVRQPDTGTGNAKRRLYWDSPVRSTIFHVQSVRAFWIRKPSSTSNHPQGGQKQASLFAYRRLAVFSYRANIFSTALVLLRYHFPLWQPLAQFVVFCGFVYHPRAIVHGCGLLLGHVLQKAGVPVIRSRGLSVTLLAGFVLTYFLANIQLLINDQLNADFLSTPLSLPVFSATCGLGVLITTLLSQFASPSTIQD